MGAAGEMFYGLSVGPLLIAGAALSALGNEIGGAGGQTAAQQKQCSPS